MNFQNRIRFGLNLDFIRLMEQIGFDNIDQASYDLQTSLLDILDMCCTLKTVKMSSKDPTFMTPYLKRLLRKKYKLRRKQKEKSSLEAEIQKEINANRTKSKNGIAMWWKEVDALLGKARKNNLKNDNDRDLLNAYFASICTTDTYVEPSLLYSSPAIISEVTIEQVYNEMIKIKKLQPVQMKFSSWCGKKMHIHRQNP